MAQKKIYPTVKRSGIAFLIAFVRDVLGSFYRCERILIHRIFHMLVADVRVYLSGVKLLVAENVLKNAHVNVSALIHKGSGGVAQLVDREALCLKPCALKVLIDHPLNRFHADALVKTAEEESLCRNCLILVAFADLQIIVQGRLAGAVKIDYALLVAFSEYAERAKISVDVGQIYADQLRNTHSAVEKKGNYRIVADPRV